MAPHDDDDDHSSILVPGPTVGPVRRRTYDPNPKHGLIDRGHVSRRPRDGQDALDWSVAVHASPDVRIGVDYDERVFVVLRYHTDGDYRGRPWDERFHGYVVAWNQLHQRMKNALIVAGMASRKGKIL